MNNINIPDDITKYKKKKKSSTSKSSEKSNHKHQYKDCLLIEKENNKPYKASYCSICGKINDLKMFETIPCGNGNRRIMDDNEIFEKYCGLESFQIDNIWQQKYINIDNK